MMKKIILNNIEYIILFAITLLLFSHLFTSYNILGADTKFHFSNIEAFYTKITDLDFYFKLLPTIGNGFFYGTPIFYSSLPHLLTALLGGILRIINIEHFLIVSMKIFYILVFFLSSVIMFKWIKSVSENRLVSLVGSVFYLTLPFKLWDVYIRNGYTEVFTFLFIPMIFYALHLLLDKKDNKRFYFYFIIGASGLTLSHLITTFFVVIACLIYLVINYKKVFQKNNLKVLSLGTIITLGITAYYWLPFLEHLIYGQYRIFQDTGLNLKEMFLNSVIPWQEYLLPSTQPGKHNFFIPITLLICFLVSCFIAIKKSKLNKNIKKVIFTSCFITIIFVFVSMCKPLLEYLPDKIYSFQYVFRMLTIPFCLMCFSASFAILLIKKRKLQKIIVSICIIITTFLSFTTIDTAYLYEGNLVGNDTSTNGMGWQKEYLPVSAYQWYNDEAMSLNQRGKGIVVLKGNPKISNEFKRNVYYEALIESNNQTYTLEYPYYYYLGYQAYIINDKQKIKIDVLESNRGLVSVESDLSGTLVLEYKGTTITITSFIISIISSIIFIVILLKYKKCKKKQ